MTKHIRWIIAVLFVGVLVGQALHLHAAHDEGVDTPHTDCVLCGWWNGNVLPSAASGPTDLAMRIVRMGLQPFKVVAAFSRLPSRIVPRAPPAS